MHGVRSRYDLMVIWKADNVGFLEVALYAITGDLLRNAEWGSKRINLRLHLLCEKIRSLLLQHANFEGKLALVHNHSLIYR